MVSEATIKEFQTAIATDHGHELTVEEAKKMLTDLVGFFDVLAQINHEDNQSGRSYQ